MRIAVLQMRAVAGDPPTNLERIAEAAREAAGQGAQLMIAPELALPGYGAGEAMAALSEEADGGRIAALSELAGQAGIGIIAGFAEKSGARTKNSAVFVDGECSPVIYRKSHLYGDYERSLFASGEPVSVLVDHCGMKIGILICYDVEFPENVRRLALAGAQLIAVPTALPAGPDAAFIARKMLPVRAFENQLFVAYANHCGADERFTYAGLSIIAAPDGSHLATAGEADEALLIADIDPSDYGESAARNTYLADLKTA